MKKIKGKSETMGEYKKIDLTFSRRLEQVMIERNLYPAQVSKLTGIRRNLIYDYVQGTHQPNAYNIKLISIGLQVSADWLLGIKLSDISDKK